MKMQDWINKLDEFLKISEKKILKTAGAVSHEEAMQKAEKEFEKYVAKRNDRYISDFDREVKKIVEISKKKSKK